MSASRPDGAPARAAPPEALIPEEFPWESLGIEGEAETRTLVGPDRSGTLGAGFGRFRDCSFEWSLAYDEVFHVLEGEVEVEHAEGSMRAGAGTVVHVPSGNTVTYSFHGECLIFFATYPVDWEQRANG